MPSSRSPPSGFGIATRRTGLGRYVPDNSCSRIPGHAVTRYAAFLAYIQCVDARSAFVGLDPLERPLQVLSRERSV